jgi:heat shock protein HslJ
MRALRPLIAATLVTTALSVAGSGWTDEPPAVRWTLVELNGVPFAATASIDLSEPGRISGRAPCNRFFGTVLGTWPDVTFGPMATTKMACDALEDETRFLSALALVTKVEVVPAEVDTALILSGPDGTPVLSFIPAPAETP